MRTLMITCLVAANRARVLDSDLGRRVEQLLLSPNFVLLIKRHMETRDNQPILASIPTALDAIAAREARREDPTVQEDLRLARALISAVLSEQTDAMGGTGAADVAR